MVCDVVSVVGINPNGCGLLLMVASDGYLVVICSMGWDLAWFGFGFQFGVTMLGLGVWFGVLMVF